MTEASENGYLVRVRAQVMCRDEGTGGWMALGGGGLADVMVCRRGPGGADNGDTALSAANILQTEYYIHGRRINDNTLVLDCTVKDDFHYHKVMPTFHHWVSDEKRYGLTFQTAADARHFDKGVRVAVNHLYRKRNLLKPKEDDEENNIFECLNLPSESRSSSETSTASRRRDEPSQTPILSAITLPRHPLTVYVDDVVGVTDSLNLQYDDKLDDSENDRCPYVHLSAVHEYTYPAVCPSGVTGEEKSSPNTKAPPLGRDSGSMRKVRGPPPLPDKKLPPEAFRARLKCRHCHEWYLESANRAGACEFAPDLCRACVDGASCVKCAQCMLYHCMSDAEGDFASQPCACGPPGDACAKRWAGVALLSLLVPCLCCYLPLRCAHAAARRAGLAGGAHEPVRQ